MRYNTTISNPEHLRSHHTRYTEYTQAHCSEKQAITVQIRYRDRLKLHVLPCTDYDFIPNRACPTLTLKTFILFFTVLELPDLTMRYSGREVI
jgi:hypothetical protein